MPKTPVSCAVFLAFVAAAACQPPPSSSPSSQVPAASTMTPAGSIKDLMVGIVDPTADILFNAVAINVNAEGTTQKAPQSDAEWATVENGILLLAETANLLKVPGRIVAGPGEKTTSGVPNSPELTPEQIQARIDADREAWARHANDLQAASLKALKIAKSRDVTALFEMGGEVDATCEACHLAYWYPDPKTKS